MTTIPPSRERLDGGMALPLRPAAAAPLLAGDAPSRAYPAVLCDEPDRAPIAGFQDLATGALDAMAEAGEDAPILRRFLPQLTAAASRTLDGRDALAPLADVVGDACAAFRGNADVSEAAAAALDGELAAWRRRLPGSGRVVGLGEHTLLRLYEAAVRRERGARLAAFHAEVDGLVERLSEILRTDDALAPEATAAPALSSSLGGGGSFVDPGALSRVLKPARGATRLAPTRRARLERTLDLLRGFRERAAESPEWILLHPGDGVPLGLELSAQVIENADALGAAAACFDGLVEPWVDVLRALRVARLEAESAYDPELHDAVLARFDWQAFRADELLLVPPVTVCESGRRVRGPALAAFSALLRSGRPVQVLLVETTARDEGHELSGYELDLGYLAMAHREAFVAQSSLALPDHLFASLRGVARALGPGVVLVATPVWTAPVAPWLQLAAALAGRAIPCLRYDPAAGDTWAERFRLDGNPQPERIWPVYDATFTFADTAALDPGYREHFRVVAPDAFDDDQVPLADYLASLGDGASRQVPFVPVVDDDGGVARAVLTRELAFACRDRARAWRILQELAGIGNEHARQAAAAAREAALEEARAELREAEAAHAQALAAVRREAAGEAMDRLVAVLLDVASSPIPAAPAAPAAAPPAREAAPEAEPEAAAAPATAAPPAPADAVEEAYIDSELCTTCNECINLNSQMFKYDENKQAYLADVSAGTYAQLVKAATQCPSRCIHPGSPRPGDDTATPELVAQAAEFN